MFESRQFHTFKVTESNYDVIHFFLFCFKVEACLKVYSLERGLEDGKDGEYHILYDAGPPPYGEKKLFVVLSYFSLNLTLSVGMKAECRQFAVQTHHIDPHNYGFKMRLEIHHMTKNNLVSLFEIPFENPSKAHIKLKYWTNTFRTKKLVTFGKK